MTTNSTARTPEGEREQPPRHARGVIGTALTWAGSWGLLGAALGASEVLTLDLLARHGTDVAVLAIVAPALALAALGALSGNLFAAIVFFLERSGRVDGLRLARLSAWGAPASLVVPATFAILAPTDFLPAKLVAIAVVFGLLGGGSAAATLVAARHGAALPGDQRPSLR